MYGGYQQDSGWALLYVPILILLWLFVFFAPQYKPKRKSMVTKLRNVPILLSELISSELFTGASGQTPKELYYTYIVSASWLFTERMTRGLYTVELPFVAAAHIVGFAHTSATAPSVNGDTIFERMDLEGDYPNYFTLYVEKDQQSAGRYVLDPKAMVFTIDFCRRFDWEIMDDMLYFASDGRMPSLELIDRFVDEIRPAIATTKPLVRNAHELLYVQFQPRALRCPVCDDRLIAGKQTMQCPNGHGILMTGKQMTQARQDNAARVDRPLVKIEEDSGRKLACPYCHNPMHRSQYQFTDVHIDICDKCMYRWIDSYEDQELFKDPAIMST